MIVKLLPLLDWETWRATLGTNHGLIVAPSGATRGKLGKAQRYANVLWCNLSDNWARASPFNARRIRSPGLFTRARFQLRYTTAMLISLASSGAIVVLRQFQQCLHCENETILYSGKRTAQKEMNNFLVCSTVATSEHNCPVGAAIEQMEGRWTGLVWEGFWMLKALP